MKCVLSIVFVSTIYTLSTSLTYASERYEKIECDSIKEITRNCNQCFDGGYKQVGEKFTPDLFFNAGKKTVVVFQNENTERYYFDVLNDDTNWSVSEDLIGYPSTWLWDTASDGLRRYRLIESGSSVRIYATKTGAGITLAGINDTSRPLSEYDARLNLTISMRDFLGPGQAGDLYKFNSCIFYKAAR